MFQIIKKEGKKVQAYRLGDANKTLEKLMEEGKNLVLIENNASENSSSKKKKSNSSNRSFIKSNKIYYIIITLVILHYILPFLLTFMSSNL